MEDSANAFQYLDEIYIMYIIVGIFSIIAALMMRKLKKTGYFIYSIVTLLYIVFPFILIGLNLASLGYLFNALIGITFIILYGVNLKHLKN